MKCLVEGTVQTVCDVRKRTRSCGTVQLVQASPTQLAKEQTYRAFLVALLTYTYTVLTETHFAGCALLIAYSAYSLLMLFQLPLLV